MENNHTESVFGSALQNARDITDNYALTYGFPTEELEKLHDSNHVIEGKIRTIMEQEPTSHAFLFRLNEMAAAKRNEARLLLDQGQVAAVDGTNAVHLIRDLNVGVYAVAVGYVTSRERSTPAVTITRTSTKYRRPEQLQRINKSELAALCQQLDAEREERSWPTTFREYYERCCALTCKQPAVFLDGPLVTQNLVSQPQGRALYEEMRASPQVLIGVIKDLRGSWAMCRWCAYCLKPGEGYVLCSIKSQLQDRFVHQQGKTAHDWINTMSDVYVRVVYRPVNKSFAFECRLQELPLATALLLEDASVTINHEIPLLLETIDANLRGGFDATAVSQAVVGRLHDLNFRLGVELLEERSLR